jgi:hypothetical protein
MASLVKEFMTNLSLQQSSNKLFQEVCIDTMTDLLSKILGSSLGLIDATHLKMGSCKSNLSLKWQYLLHQEKN